MIGILTFHNTTNYGSMLQTFALQKAIENLGIQCEVIDYECKSVEKNEMPLKIVDCNRIKKILRYILLNKYRKRKLKKFLEFRNNELKISTIRYNQSTIRDSNDKFEGFVVGSDIVWGLDITGHDYTFFLNFAEKGKLKISYAASLGNDLIENKEKIKLYLNDFDGISIRESAGIEIIDKITKKSVEVVLDPTLLHNSNFWDKYTAERQIKDKYILIYFALLPDEVFVKARQLAKKMGCKIVYIQDTLRQIPDFINIRDASINQFLSYIKYSEYVITGSYHGVAFSINYNKQFVTNNKDYTSRIRCLLELLEIGNRDIKEYDSQINAIDYEKTNKKLEIYREKSKTWLKDALKRL